MQFSTGITRSTQSKSYMLSLTEDVCEFRNNALWISNLMFCLSDTVMVSQYTFKHLCCPFVSLYSTIKINYMYMYSIYGRGAQPFLQGGLIYSMEYLWGPQTTIQTKMHGYIIT